MLLLIFLFAFAVFFKFREVEDRIRRYSADFVAFLAVELVNVDLEAVTDLSRSSYAEFSVLRERFGIGLALNVGKCEIASFGKELTKLFVDALESRRR